MKVEKKQVLNNKLTLVLFIISGSVMLMSAVTNSGIPVNPLNTGKVISEANNVIPTQVPWVAPKEADATKNPLKDDALATADGKKLYVKLCAVCHGEKGKGDGPAGIMLSPRPANHSSMKVQSQSDGALYWKITTGRAPMASYNTSLKDAQRWGLVNYIRTLALSDKKVSK
jgi:mono/diheme cytochrome c family protein